MSLLNGFVSDEIIELLLVAVEHIDVDIALNTCHTTIRTKLPVGQTYVWLILTIARYPHAVVVLQVGLILQIIVYEHLIHVEDRLYVGVLLHHREPRTDMTEHRLRATHLSDL